MPFRTRASDETAAASNRAAVAKKRCKKIVPHHSRLPCGMRLVSTSWMIHGINPKPWAVGRGR
jgi:hypothetical protein